jgi:dihydroflavonol-4-reductase
VRYLAHAAADYRLWSPVPDEIIRTNVDGTRAVMEEALRAGVERVVYTSSVATIELRDGAPADEARPLPESKAVGAYKKSKVIAERLVEDMIGQRGLPAVIVNPSTPIGPRDVKPTPTGRIIVEGARGRMPGFVDTGLNLAHVDDVAAGHIAALERGRIGERYILGGDDVLLADMLAEIARVVGRSPPRIKLPLAPLLPVAWASETIARWGGGTPFLTRDALHMAKHRMFFTHAKARRELGYRARPYQEGIADAIAWFRNAGYLR